VNSVSGYFTVASIVSATVFFLQDLKTSSISNSSSPSVKT